MKTGFKSSEFTGVAAVALMAAAKIFGVTPEDATMVTQETIPLLIDLVKDNSPILVAGGLVWAYLKRRSALKSKQMGNDTQ